jgi:hypothetical protein
MKYEIIFNVVDNNYVEIHNEMLRKELTDQTVGEIKSLSNNGRYTDIKQEVFFSESTGPNPTDDKIITTPNILYLIVMN